MIITMTSKELAELIKEFQVRPDDPKEELKPKATNTATIYSPYSSEYSSRLTRG